MQHHLGPLVNFRKLHENTLQDQFSTEIATTSNIDAIDTLHESLAVYYQQSLSVLPVSTLPTVLFRHIPHQQEIDRFLKNFGTKVLHTYNLPNKPKNTNILLDSKMYIYT